MANRYLSANEKSRARGLLDMMYTPSELAWETLIDEKRLTKVLPGIGMPHVVGEDGQMWIHGLEFAAWAKSFDRSAKVSLASDHAYCLRCRRPVPLLNPRQVQGYMATLLQAPCPTCGATVNRAIKSPGSRRS